MRALNCGFRARSHEIDRMSQCCRQPLLQTDKRNQANRPREFDEQIDVAVRRRSPVRDRAEDVERRHAVFE